MNKSDDLVLEQSLTVTSVSVLCPLSAVHPSAFRVRVPLSRRAAARNVNRRGTCVPAVRWLHGTRGTTAPARHSRRSRRCGRRARRPPGCLPPCTRRTLACVAAAHHPRAAAPVTICYPGSDQMSPWRRTSQGQACWAGQGRLGAGVDRGYA